MRTTTVGRSGIRFNNNDIAILNDELFLEYFKQWKETGDIYYRNLITNANMRLVIHSAQKFKHHTSTTRDDLVQEGYFGLLHALNKFDPDKGEFSTYATFWIRVYMQKAVRNSRLITIPDKTLRQLLKYQRISRENPDMSPMEVLDSMGMKTKRKAKMLRIIKAHVNVQSLSDESDDTSLDEVMACPNSPEPLNNLIEGEEKVVFGEVITKLGDRAHKILILRSKGQTFEQIGRKMGLTKQRVEQIQKEAIAEARKLTA